MPRGLCEHGNSAHRGTAENALPPKQPQGPPSRLLRSYAHVCDLHRQVVECSHQVAPATKRYQARAQMRLFQGGSLGEKSGKARIGASVNTDFS